MEKHGITPVHITHPDTLGTLLASCEQQSQHDFLTVSQLCVSQFQLGTSLPPGNPRGSAQKNCPGGRDLTFESCPGAENSTRAGILRKFKVKHFVRVLVLLVINTGSQKLLKMGNTTLLISSSNNAKRRINVCSGGDLC